MENTDLFSERVRELRECKAKTDSSFSIRKVAQRIGIEPSYLSKIERGLLPPPGEGTIKALAMELGQNEDVLLALAGKISTDVKNIIQDNPLRYANLIRTLKEIPDDHFDKIDTYVRRVRRVTDPEWDQPSIAKKRRAS
jgi:transcriptional regulator with XRE-family HTH domain